MEYELTTDNSASSYGVPVVVIDGVAYGAMDRLPNGEIAFYFIKEQEHELKERFLRSAPDLFFNL